MRCTWEEGERGVREDVEHAGEAGDVPALPVRPVARVISIMLGVGQVDGLCVVGEFLCTVQGLLFGEKDAVVGGCWPDPTRRRVRNRLGRVL